MYYMYIYYTYLLIHVLHVHILYILLIHVLHVHILHNLIMAVHKETHAHIMLSKLILPYMVNNTKQTHYMETTQ